MSEETQKRRRPTQRPTQPADTHPSPTAAPPIQPTHLLRIPLELLVEFLLRARTDDQDIPWSLQHVNRDLRHIVTTNPLLWNIVDIGYGPTRALLHINRSGQTPLLVSCSVFNPKGKLETIDKFVALLLPHTERIRALRIVFGSQE